VVSARSARLIGRVPEVPEFTRPCSWLNVVEIFFGIITTAIGAFIVACTTGLYEPIPAETTWPQLPDEKGVSQVPPIVSVRVVGHGLVIVQSKSSRRTAADRGDMGSSG
jgi:hypothetical protein